MEEALSISSFKQTTKAKLKFICRFEYGSSLPSENRSDGDYPVFGSNGIVGSHNTANTVGQSIIIGRKGSFGKINFSENPAFAIDTTYFIDSRFTKNNLRWLYYALNILGLDEVSNDTGVPGLSREYAYENKLLLPSLELQDAIAKFLDSKCFQIDTLISKKETLISLLEEKRKATISQAVTRGLNPEVKLKDSGVEWLGQVPEHWEVRRLSRLTTQITNGYVGPTRDLFQDSGVRYLQSLHIKNGSVLFNKEYYVSEEWSNSHSKSILKTGNVVIVQTGDLGQCAVIDESWEGSNCHALIIVKLLPSLMNGFFLSYFLRSDYGRNALLSNKTGALHPHLECGKVKEIFVATPPLVEQVQIVKFLTEATSKIELLIDKLKQSIEKLKEYRSAVITAAVTGQMEVPEHLPE